MEKAQVIQTLLFVSGVNTLLQTWFGSRLPVVIGGSFRFIIPSLYVAFAQRYFNYLNPYLVSLQYLFTPVGFSCNCYIVRIHIYLLVNNFSYHWLRGLYKRWGQYKVLSWLLPYFLCCLVFWEFGELLWGRCLTWSRLLVDSLRKNNN